MKSFLIALPLTDNARKPMDAAHATFQKLALSIAGGYTKRPSGEGVWQDSDGKVYYDRMVPYVFACERATFDQLKRLAFDLFPDQVALFWQELGEVTIERRPAARQPDRATRFSGTLKRAATAGAIVLALLAATPSHVEARGHASNVGGRPDGKTGRYSSTFNHTTGTYKIWSASRQTRELEVFPKAIEGGHTGRAPSRASLDALAAEHMK